VERLEQVIDAMAISYASTSLAEPLNQAGTYLATWRGCWTGATGRVTRWRTAGATSARLVSAVAVSYAGRVG